MLDFWPSQRQSKAGYCPINLLTGGHGLGIDLVDSEILTRGESDDSGVLVLTLSNTDMGATE